MFKSAIANSPSKSVDIVVANAGITAGRADPMHELGDLEIDPEKPDLKVLDVNLYGVMYTTKLAFHYFQKHPLDDKHDRCLIVQTSLAAYLDLPGAMQYQVSKYGGRGLMACIRRTTGVDGVRVNTICPWYVNSLR
jgi:NAD(P)-dependent dehydrogenase (short-subunit alcohol dehydrogenase family)